MAVQNPYQQYMEKNLSTMTPEELTLMLYKGIVKFIMLAMNALDQNIFDVTNNNIVKAQNIYYHLLGTLDEQYPISKDLANLYNFQLTLLMEANIQKDKEKLEVALGFARDFADTWEEAVKIHRRSRNGAPVIQAR